MQDYYSYSLLNQILLYAQVTRLLKSVSDPVFSPYSYHFRLPKKIYPYPHLYIIRSPSNLTKKNELGYGQSNIRTDPIR